MEDIRVLAEAQHGVVSRVQTREIGLSIEQPFNRGEWEALSPRVIRLVGAPRTPRTEVMAAVLDAGTGAAASHRTAAALWGLTGFDLVPPEVTRPYGVERFRPTLGRLHRTRLLPPHHVTTVDGIPVTTVARTLFDLAAVLHPGRTERVLDSAVAASPALLPVLHRMLPELAERGRTGIRLMRELLGARPLGYLAPASGLEARLIRLLDEAGIATRRQVDLGADGWIGRVDLLVTGTNIVIEVDSTRFHTSRLDRERDARRDAELRAGGYEVLRITEEDVWYRPAEVVQRVRAEVRAVA
jgi:very-short-patch-repair endonuclease